MNLKKYKEHILHLEKKMLGGSFLACRDLISRTKHIKQ